MVIRLHKKARTSPEIHREIPSPDRMPAEAQRRYPFAAIDRATRWVYLETHYTKEAKVAAAFIDRLADKAPFLTTKALTDNGKEFTDHFCATGKLTNRESSL